MSFQRLFWFGSGITSVLGLPAPVVAALSEDEQVEHVIYSSGKTWEYSTASDKLS